MVPDQLVAYDFLAVLWTHGDADRSLWNDVANARASKGEKIFGVGAVCIGIAVAQVLLLKALDDLVYRLVVKGDQLIANSNGKDIGRKPLFIDVGNKSAPLSAFDLKGKRSFFGGVKIDAHMVVVHRVKKIAQEILVPFYRGLFHVLDFSFALADFSIQVPA